MDLVSWGRIVKFPLLEKICSFSGLHLSFPLPLGREDFPVWYGSVYNCLIILGQRHRVIIFQAFRLKLRQGWGQRGGLGRNSCPAGPKPSPLFPDSSCTAFNWTGHHLTCTGHSAANSKKWQKIKRNLDSTQFNWNHHHYFSHSALNDLLLQEPFNFCKRR